MHNNFITRSFAVAISCSLVSSIVGIAFFYEKVSVNIIYLLLFSSVGFLFSSLVWIFFESFKSPGAITDQTLNNLKTRLSLALLFSSVPLLLFLPYFIYKKSQGNEYWPPSMDVSTSAFILFILWIFLLPTLLLLFKRPATNSWTKKWFDIKLPQILKSPVILLFILSFAWLIVTVILSLRFYSLNNYWTKDTAYIDQAFWSARTGDGFFTSTMPRNNPGYSIFGLHSSYAMLFFFPFYVIWPSYKALIVLSNIALASAAFPLYFLGRQIIGKTAALLIAATYLFHPTVLSQASIGGIHDVNLFPLLFLLCFLAFYKKNYWLFFIFAILAILVKEEFAFTISMFGVYALITRRSVKWVLMPVFISLAWFVFSITYLIPSFNAYDNISHLYFRNFGNSWPEIINTFLTNPIFIFKEVLALDDLHLLYGLFITTGFFLPILSGAVIISFPSLALNLMSSSPPKLITWYLFGTVAALFAAMVLGIKNLPGSLKSSIERTFGRRAPTLIATILLIINLSTFYIWLKPELFKEQVWSEPSNFVTEIVPVNASIIVPTYLTNDFAKNKYIIDYTQESDFQWPDPDIIIIDSKVESRFEPKSIKYYALAVAAAADKDRYELIGESGNLSVYRKIDSVSD